MLDTSLRAGRRIPCVGHLLWDSDPGPGTPAARRLTEEHGMSDGKRPGGVTFVIALIWISAFVNAALGIWLIILMFGDNPSLTDWQGNTFEIPSFWLLMNGMLSLLLGFMYVWLARMAALGAASAQVIIQALAVINIVFGLFRLPYGWLALVLNILILIIVSGAKSKAWFSRPI